MQGSCNDACCPPSIQTDYSIRATCQTDCQHTRRWVPEAGRPAQWHKAVQTLFSVMVPHAIPLVEPLRWGDPRLQVTMGANGGSGCGGFAWEHPCGRGFRPGGVHGNTDRGAPRQFQPTASTEAALHLKFTTTAFPVVLPREVSTAAIHAACCRHPCVRSFEAGLLVAPSALHVPVA